MKDLFEACQERDKAIGSVTANSTEEFKTEIRNVVMTILIIHDKFTADDVWEELEKRQIKGFSSDPRALGGILKSFMKEGMIEPTGQYQQSTRRHAAPIMIWKRT